MAKQPMVKTPVLPQLSHLWGIFHWWQKEKFGGGGDGGWCGTYLTSCPCLVWWEAAGQLQKPARGPASGAVVSTVNYTGLPLLLLKLL